MNLANKFTLARICVVPLYVLFMGLGGFCNYVLAFIIFCAAAVTDFFDGQIARKNGTVTSLGIFLDPLADKLLISSAFVCFVSIPILNVCAWMVVTMVSREFVITGFRYIAVLKNVIIPADKSGKFKTGLQVVSIIVIMMILIANEALLKFAGITINTIADGYGDYRTLAIMVKNIPFWATFVVVIFVIFSFLNYMWKYRSLLNKKW